MISYLLVSVPGLNLLFSFAFFLPYIKLGYPGRSSFMLSLECPFVKIQLA